MKSITKGHLGFSQGMFVGQSMPKYEGGSREVDWNMVKEFIETNKDNIASVSVGLAEDWTYTSGVVWNKENGYIPQDDTYVYGSSTWATPAIEVEFSDGDVDMFEVWKLGDNALGYFDL